MLQVRDGRGLEGLDGVSVPGGGAPVTVTLRPVAALPALVSRGHRVGPPPMRKVRHHENEPASAVEMLCVSVISVLVLFHDDVLNGQAKQCRKWKGHFCATCLQNVRIPKKESAGYQYTNSIPKIILTIVCSIA